MEPGNLIPPGIWTLADVLQYGRDKKVCPYFVVRRMVSGCGPALVCSLWNFFFRCLSSMSLFILFTTSWTQKSQSKSRKKCRKMP